MYTVLSLLHSVTCSTMFLCFKCRAAFPQYNVLTRHLRHYYALRTKAQAKTRLTYVQRGQQFNSPASFRYHLLSCKKGAVNNDGMCAATSRATLNTGDESQVGDVQSNTSDIAFQGCEGDDALPDRETPEPTVVSRKKKKQIDRLTKDIGLLTMKMRGRFRTSHSSLNFLVKDRSDILEKTDMSAVQIKDDVKSLKTLQSKQRRMTFYRRHFGLINPSERFVSHRFDRRVRNGTTVPKQVSNTFQYVSIQLQLHIHTITIALRYARAIINCKMIARP